MQVSSTSQTSGVKDQGLHTLAVVSGQVIDAETLKCGPDVINNATSATDHHVPANDRGASAPSIQDNRIGESEVLDQQLADRAG